MDLLTTLATTDLMQLRGWVTALCAVVQLADAILELIHNVRARKPKQ